MTKRDEVIMIFNESALTEGNEPAFKKALEAYEEELTERHIKAFKDFSHYFDSGEGKYLVGRDEKLKEWLSG